MSRRRKAREIVLQALYEREFSELPAAEIVERLIASRGPTEETAAHARALLAATVAHIDEIDGTIAAALENWEMGRVALVDKNILRFSLAELLYFADVPPAVVINEAIEIARRFSTEDAGRFVNGLLDRFARELRRDAV
jgi:N utilization substance protein B